MTVRETQRALPISGIMKASFRFNIFKGKYGKKKYIKDYVGSNAQYNCAKNRNKMIRLCHEHAKIIMINDFHGDYNLRYTSFLQGYYFRYDYDNAKGKTGKVYSVDYYNSQVPDNEQKHTSGLVEVYKERKQRETQRSKAKQGINIIRGYNNEKRTTSNNNKHTETKRGLKTNKNHRKQNKKQIHRNPIQTRNTSTKKKNFENAKRILRQ
jgi:hypothetical protein